MLHDWSVHRSRVRIHRFWSSSRATAERLTHLQRVRLGTLIYPLSLAIYCTSWTFFGSVGLATRPASSSWRSMSARS